MKKERIIIFGAAGTGQKIYKRMKETANVICFSENNSDLWGTYIDGIEVVEPGEIKKKRFDYIYIGSMCGFEEITEQLLAMGIPKHKLVNDTVLVQTKSRILFLENAAYILGRRNPKKGAVAEAGVYRGDFSKEINRCFSDRKMYLFDTFEGFNEIDIVEEPNTSMTSADYLKETSESLVLNKMPYKERCIIKKGFFPDTAKGLDEEFIFVSLDMDLYKPTLEGLIYFYPRMVPGGIIVIHDYFSDAYPNIKLAVEEYETIYSCKLNLCPVGDDISIAIIK